MAWDRIRAALAAGLIATAVCACRSVGPASVERDRLDYGSAIADSWKQQTLLNIVKLRYGDMPIFLEIAQVIAGYQLESTVSAGVSGANTAGSVPQMFTFGGSAVAEGKYIDRPTLIYAPLVGTDFLKKLMTPISPAAVLFMLQSGYAADVFMPIAVNSINGTSNESRRRADRPPDPDFVRLVQLLREMQLADAVQVRIERAERDSESAIIVFPPSKDPRLAAKGAEIRRLLHLKPGARELRVYYGGDSGRDDEISMLTRSMLQIMLEIAAIVQVPASDVETGRAAPGVVAARPSETRPSTMLTILSGETEPSDAYVAVAYRGRWFWIENTDLSSKHTFASVMLLFSISDAGVRTNAPVVTVPAN